jgi:hypothetical protein
MPSNKLLEKELGEAFECTGTWWPPRNALPLDTKFKLRMYYASYIRGENDNYEKNIHHENFAPVT